MNPDEIYQLLPSVYRIRDHQQGGPLQALMRIIGEQASYVHEDIEQLYDNWFAETCDDAIVPYLGELVGFRRSHAIGEPGDSNSATVERLRQIYPRREVSRLVDSRRRKGTLQVFEDLAMNIGGWHAEAIEDLCSTLISSVIRFSSILPMNQAKDSQRCVDTRRSFWPGNIRVRVWRRNARSVSGILPTRLDLGTIDGKEWVIASLSPFGIDNPLVFKPQKSWVDNVNADICASHKKSHSCDLTDLPIEYPTFILAEHIRNALSGCSEDHSVSELFTDSLLINGLNLLPSNIHVTKLTTLPRRVSRNAKLLIDPERGRIAVPVDKAFPRVTCFVAKRGTIGGGEYIRDIAYHDEYPVYRHVPSQANRITQKIRDILMLSRELTTGAGGSVRVESSVGFELAGNAVHNAPPQTIRILRNRTFELRAGNQVQPVIRIANGEMFGTLTIHMEPGSRLVVDGIAILAKEILIHSVEAAPNSQAPRDTCCVEPADDRIEAPKVYIRHATVAPKTFSDDSLGKIKACLPGGLISIQHSSIADVEVEPGCQPTARCPGPPIRIRIHDSIMDGPVSAGVGPTADASLDCQRSTALGRIDVREIEADDSIFNCGVHVERQQHGFLRFCFVKKESSAEHPVKYKCFEDEPPSFITKSFGHFGYGELALNCPSEILAGAESESEMGAFHDLFEPQRRARLESQQEEFTPVDLNSVIEYVDESAPD